MVNEISLEISHQVRGEILNLEAKNRQLWESGDLLIMLDLMKGYSAAFVHLHGDAELKNRLLHLTPNLLDHELERVWLQGREVRVKLDPEGYVFAWCESQREGTRSFSPQVA